MPVIALHTGKELRMILYYLYTHLFLRTLVLKDCVFSILDE